KTEIIVKANKRRARQESIQRFKESIANARTNQKNKRAQRLVNSFSFSILEKTEKVMDNLLWGIGLDPLLGFLPLGSGDIITSITSLPSLYVSLFKVRSIPLTLAVVKNILVDVLIGCIPTLGNILDFFVRSHKKNYELVVGYTKGDEQVIKEVNNGAWLMFFLILILSLAIYLVVKLLATLGGWVFRLFS
ncbi:MAG: DUF4112 domain-containing protein, partial [Alistipes sp.]|nr:DUF4112 domain-containing protein [Alistipes sp.]